MNFLFLSTSNLLMAEALEVRASGGGEVEVPDGELVAQSQAGDYRAFDVLVTRHRGKVYAMVQNMVKNEADAWDLSQEVFLKVWKALPKFEGRAKFSTWLYRIVHNVVYDWNRKRKMKVAGELNDNILEESSIDVSSRTTPASASAPDKALARAELRAHIEEAMDKLPVEHREVIIMREVNGLNYKEIAEITGCSLGTVMSRLFYARKKLQGYISYE